MRKNGFITLCCSVFPGFGQMYQGYMRRGASLALFFWGVIFFAALLNLGVLSLILPVIWAYSFFDTFNIRSLSPEQRARFKDDYIPSSAWMEKNNASGFLQKFKTSKIAGYALIGIGVLVIYQNFISMLYFRLRNVLPLLADMLDNLPRFLFAAAIIIAGIYLLRKNTGNPYEDEISQFKGGNNE